MILLLKSSVVQVKGHTRSGVFVAAHTRHADTYADKAHTGQYRKGKLGAAKVPYIEHPRAVARILHDEAGITDKATLQAALLHDTIEDTGTTHQQLVAAFGTDVADLVAELTNPPDFGPIGKAAWQAEHAAKMSERAAAIKTADKIANLRDILRNPPDWNTQRKHQYFDDARQVVESMGKKNPKLIALFNATYAEGMRHFNNV